MRVLFACVVVVSSFPAVASAQTTIAGGSILNQTWTTAGSPYNVQGDITVPTGSFLRIEAGVEVVFATSDASGAGLDPDLIELTVQGELTVSGAAGNRVAFRGSGSPGDWYGIVVANGASAASITEVDIQDAHYGIRNDDFGGVLDVLNASVRSTSSHGVWIRAGDVDLDGLTVTGSASRGLSVEGGAISLSNCVLSENASYGAYFASGSSITVSDVTHCTIHGNDSYGMYVTGSSNLRLTVRNNIITNNQTYGIFRVSSPQVTNSHNNVWGQGTDYSGLSAGTGSLSTNPIYVSEPTNLRITANSPARFAGSSSGDLGALPFTGDPTPGLYGTLWSDTTLTAAASPHSVDGDLRVAAGVTLTVEPGSVLQIADTDIMAAGRETNRTELQVEGNLTALGTALEPVAFEGLVATRGSWQGIVFEASAAGSDITHASIRDAVVGVTYDTANRNRVSFSTISSTSEHGVQIDRGAHTLDAITVMDASHGVSVQGGGVTLTNSVLRGNRSYGIYLSSSGVISLSVIANCTIHGNDSHGVHATGNSNLRLMVRNTIVTSNQTFGIRREGAPQVTLFNNDVWDQPTDWSGVSPPASSLSVDPEFVAAPMDLRLVGSSPVIDQGSSLSAPNHDRNDETRPLDGDGVGGVGYDMGAYEHRQAVCGNGTLEIGEACDDGADNGDYGFCAGDCLGPGPFCGDGTANGPEPCDDANSVETDACTSACEDAVCGDGFVQAGVEECDDGNAAAGDGCEACRLVAAGVDAGIADAGPGDDGGADAAVGDAGMGDAGPPPPGSEDGGCRVTPGSRPSSLVWIALGALVVLRRRRTPAAQRE